MGVAILAAVVLFVVVRGIQLFLYQGSIEQRLDDL